MQCKKCGKDISEMEVNIKNFSFGGYIEFVCKCGNKHKIYLP